MQFPNEIQAIINQYTKQHRLHCVNTDYKLRGVPVSSAYLHMTGGRDYIYSFEHLHNDR